MIGEITIMRPYAAMEVEMRKSIYRVLGLLVLIVALFAFRGTKDASAEVSVNINIGPPLITVAEPPEVVMIPGLQVFFVPQLEFDVFFYNGYWWSPRGNRWYRSRAYNGPWGVINRRYVPTPVYQVPKDYRGRYEREQHIPYGQWKHQERKEHREGKDHKKDHKHGRGHGNK